MFKGSRVIRPPTKVLKLRHVKARGGGVRGHFSMLNIYERAPGDGQEEKNRIKIRPSVQKLARAKTEVYNVIVCNFQP